MKTAGTPGAYAGAVSHVGRRSGRIASAMFADRTTARIVEGLFIVATVTAIVGGALVEGPLKRSNALVDVAGSEGRVVTGVLFELVLVVSVVGIGALLFPVLRRRNEGLAMGYVGTRILESVLLLAASVSGLMFLKLSQEHGRAGLDGLAPLGDAVLAGRDRSSLLGGLVMLGVSTLILNSLLLTAKLVPAWLAGWGLIGGALVLVCGALELYGLHLDAVVQALLTAPVAVYEMVLAVRLILRGFDEPVVVVGS
jgi:hypothetical protein